jgi:uncharacterized membrane protein
MASRSRAWRPAESLLADPRVNVGHAERYASAAAGAALANWALRRRSREAWVLGALSAVMWYRAATGRCPVYSAAGVSTADETSTRRALSGRRGVNVESAVTINRAVEELYGYWRNFENLPRIMHHLVSVEQIDSRRSRWTAKAPMGATVTWDAEIINEVPNKVIGWRSLEGSTVVSAGSVNFEPLPGDRGTVVRVKLQYEPPAGRLGSWFAWLFGEEPSVQVREDLRRFKQLMEAGEVPTTAGQPVGGRA